MTSAGVNAAAAGRVGVNRTTARLHRPGFAALRRGEPSFTACFGVPLAACPPVLINSVPLAVYLPGVASAKPGLPVLIGRVPPAARPRSTTLWPGRCRDKKHIVRLAGTK